MKQVDGRLLFSPSDLGDFVACEHLMQLETAGVLGELGRPYFANPYGDLIARKGDEHEAFLAGLRSAGPEVVEVGLGEDRR